MTSGETYAARKTPVIAGPTAPPTVLNSVFILVAMPVCDCSTDYMTTLIIAVSIKPTPILAKITPRTTCSSVAWNR